MSVVYTSIVAKPRARVTSRCTRYVSGVPRMPAKSIGLYGINRKSAFHQSSIGLSSIVNRPFINHQSAFHQSSIGLSSIINRPFINHQSAFHQSSIGLSSIINRPLRHLNKAASEPMHKRTSKNPGGEWSSFGESLEAKHAQQLNEEKKSGGGGEVKRKKNPGNGKLNLLHNFPKSKELNIKGSTQKRKDRWSKSST
jgi:hypothetical protein